MADKTFGFKVTDEVYERAKMMIDSSGLTNKDWFENALAMYEVKSFQFTAPEYTRNLNELELHTTRIYELVANMVQQSVYFKEQAVRDVSEQLEKKDALVNELQKKLHITKEYVTTLESVNKEHTEQLLISQKQLDEARNSIENSQLLIAEYKEKNNSLTELLTKYQGFAEENERLKGDFAREKAKLIESMENEKKALENALNASQIEVTSGLTKINQLDTATNKLEQEIALQTERHELALEKALVQADREYRATLQEQLDKYNDRVAMLQAQNERFRDSYEARLNNA